MNEIEWDDTLQCHLKPLEVFFLRENRLVDGWIPAGLAGELPEHKAGFDYIVYVFSTDMSTIYNMIRCVVYHHLAT